MKKEENIMDVLSSKTKFKIWVISINHPGLSASELATEMKLKQPAISRQLPKLEKVNLIKIKYDAVGKGVKKRIYPSLQGIISFIIEFEEEFKGKDFPGNKELLYETIDEMFLENKENKEMLIKGITNTKERGEKQGVLGIVFSMFSVIKITLTNKKQINQFMKRLDGNKRKVFNKFLEFLS